MPAQKRRQLTPAQQKARFIAGAKELEADETGAKFEKAFKKIVKKVRSNSKR